MAEVYTDRNSRRPFAANTTPNPLGSTVRTHAPASSTVHRGLSATAKVGIGLLLIALAVIFLLMLIF